MGNRFGKDWKLRANDTGNYSSETVLSTRTAWGLSFHNEGHFIVAWNEINFFTPSVKVVKIIIGNLDSCYEEDRALLDKILSRDEYREVHEMTKQVINNPYLDLEQLLKEKKV